ncbi:hypothetical protein Ga0074812_12956 [Parafrankia irregularis]|uniref:Uncharacterized protein n=1 Tax=Parafrankia irregularis TaxID=795642 RepID=A0A0S4QX23_9ACTN|nr:MULTISPECIES: hypothetical protein [Parafrankia]MBE3202490.1 hypothetical protein [Parafrankia sp. CH37]CUU59586.1 hypothetical protein Ga0074812_12956 [Parafrankia irregularis]
MHAVVAGAVTTWPPPESQLALRGDDGREYRFAGVRALVASGSRVRVGQVVAVVAGHSGGGPSRPAVLEVEVTGADGRPLDGYGLFAGLADPAAYVDLTEGTDPELVAVDRHDDLLSGYRGAVGGWGVLR